jgi:hypothetical protein
MLPGIDAKGNLIERRVHWTPSGRVLRPRGIWTPTENRYTVKVEKRRRRIHSGEGRLRDNDGSFYPMGARRAPVKCGNADTRVSQPRRASRSKKKEVKTEVFTSRGGVMHDKRPRGAVDLPCQAGPQPHSRTAEKQRVRRLTIQGLVFIAFLAPERYGVNGKKGHE